MNNFTKDMIHDYADKLLIGLSDEECNTLLDEFDVIKERMEIISNIPGIEEVEPQHFPCEFTLSSLRKDIPQESLPIEDVLANCDDSIERVVEVPKVVG